MKAVVLRKFGAPERLVLEDAPDPVPQKGEALIRVRAAGVNFADIVARLGLYPDAPPRPMILGYEVAGTLVDALPEQGLAAGIRVVAPVMFGGYAELAVADSRAVRAIPDACDDATAASIPVVYLTAYRGLFGATTVKAGETVLVHAAAGGVGLAAIELCRIAGATVIGTASAAKRDFLVGQGVSHVIDYRTQDFEAEVMRITNGAGVDVVLDSQGGASLKKGARLLRHGGRLVMYGVSSMVTGERRSLWSALKTLVGMPRFHPVSLMNNNRAVLGINMNHFGVKNPDSLSRDLDQILAWVQGGKLHPRVDRTFPLGDAAAAHRYIQERKNIGKVVLTVND
jgi:NADPH:quinone reductase-like Zn-dependent oxidoreductase